MYINTGLQRPMRAPGHPQGSFITEIMMDELADLVKMDPIEFRIKNLPPEGANAMWRSYLREGAEAFGWSKRHPTGDPTAGSIKTGMGVAICTWGGGGRGPSPTQCEIAADGSVIVRTGTQDIGTGQRTLVAMVAADALGLQPSQVTPEIGDTQYGVSGGSGGSTTAASTTPAIRIAALKALEALKEKVAPALGVTADALVAAGGRIQVKDTPSKSLSWADACKRIGPQPVTAVADWAPGMSSATTSGVQFAEATVDIKTGIVKVTRVLAIQDCGLVLNQLTAESQVYGGVIGSLNFALYEDRILDRRTGQMVNPNMEWYLLAGMSDIPQIDVRLKNMPERGVVGIGEPPTVPTAAAIALAVRNAIGVDGAQPAADAGEDFRVAPAESVRTHEAICLRQSREREGRRRRAVQGAREGDADRRRPGPAGADEGLRHAAGSHRQREEPRRDGHPRQRRTAHRLGDEDGGRRRTCRHRPPVSRGRGGGDRSRHAADPKPGDRRRQPQSAPALLVLPQRRVRLLQEGRQPVFLAGRGKPVPRHLRRRTELHRPSVESRGAVCRL